MRCSSTFFPSLHQSFSFSRHYCTGRFLCFLGWTLNHLLAEQCFSSTLSQILYFSKWAKHLARGLLTPDDMSACERCAADGSIFNIERIVLLHLKAQHFTHKSNHKIYRDCLEFIFFFLFHSPTKSLSLTPQSPPLDLKSALLSEY